MESGDVGAVNFQAAKVKKPLAAVSDCNRKGNPVFFDGDASCIIPKNCPELAQIRALIKKAAKKIPVHLDRGVYKLRTWMKPQGPSPFRGQGR